LIKKRARRAHAVAFADLERAPWFARLAQIPSVARTLSGQALRYRKERFLRITSELHLPGSHGNLKSSPERLYKSPTELFMADELPNQTPKPVVRGRTVIAAALLLAALALVVLYTNRSAFLSPVALVVVAAIGVAALLLQRRLRPSLSSQTLPGGDRHLSSRAPLWLNAIGVVFALAALCANILHNAAYTLLAALGAVILFAVGGIIMIRALRRV
jgi:hypothetical protein